MATLYGIPAGSYEPQSDFNSQDTPNGGSTATQSYVMRRATWPQVSDDFAKGTPASDLDTNLGAIGDRYFLDRVSTQNLEGDLLRVTAYFAGFAATYDNTRATQATYTLRGVLTEKPIWEHSQLRDGTVTDTDRKIVMKLAQGELEWSFLNNDVRIIKDGFLAVWEEQPTSAIAKSFCNTVASGKVSYLAPQYTWEKTWDDDGEIPASDLNTLGKVDTPDGDPPEANGTRNWLHTSVSQVKVGELHRNRKEWLLSERNGWDATLYDY